MELKEFMSVYYDFIEEYIIEYTNEEETINEILNSEDNHNNADTNNQRVLTDIEISSLLDGAIDLYRKDEDRCSGCARKMNSDNYVFDNQPKPYTECIGYKCSECGEEDKF